MKLNENEKKVLAILKEDPYVSQQFIADQLQLSRPAIANLISGLQDKGYILGKPYMLKTEAYITCIGGANLDYTFRLEDPFTLGTSNPVQSSISYGGVIRNVADNLSRLNHKVSLMTVLGDDLSGEDLLSYSRKTMEVFACDKIKNETTGSYYAVIDKNGNMNVGLADMSINRHMNRSWILEHKRHLNMSDWLIADTNISKDGLEALIEYAALEHKKLAIIGVSGPKMKHVPDHIKGVEIIICNLDESQSYFKTDEQNLDALIQMWIKKDIKKVIITNGKNGSIYYDGSQIGYQKAYIVNEDRVVDVTGAGDAFSSAVLHGLIKGETLAQSIKYGAINSSLTIQSSYAVNPNISINLIKKELKKYENI
ncbi:MAG: PfkB family carbohydrate kinase [Acholeplasmataceae bacterium]|jgi:sugar/nucleoside kinase (ribokinase family)|nr:PfkB family carbohydrate kinase [Acholeplasmataceae bacterium]